MTETVTNSDTLLRTLARTLLIQSAIQTQILRSLGRTISEIVKLRTNPGYFLRFDGHKTISLLPFPVGESICLQGLILRFGSGDNGPDEVFCMGKNCLAMQP
jgi:hypothetical protein